MHRTTVLIPEDLKVAAQRYARRHGKSLGDLIRESLRQRLQQESAASRAEDPLFADRAVYEGEAPSDLAARHDDYLYDEPAA